MDPIAESEATVEIREIFLKLKRGFNTATVPLYFRYLANFPPYLQYIFDQLYPNISSKQFYDLTEGSCEMIKKQMKTEIPYTSEIIDWFERYKVAPSFYHFVKSLRKTHHLNTQLAFLFLAVREATKGWAVAAKKLEADLEDSAPKVPDVSEEQIWEMSVGLDLDGINTESGSLMYKSQELDQAGQLEAQVYHQYLVLCRNQLIFEQKKAEFLVYRVKVEAAILEALDYLPSPILAPINVVAELMEDKRAYYSLVYLLAEHFPTFAMQRLMFSAYMLP